jgi:hypothetical protein
MKRWLILGMILLGLLGSVEAADRIASTGGSGSTCSVGSPCSLATAVNSAATGDNIYLRAGTYSLSTGLSPVGGTSTNRTIIDKYPGDARPIVRATAGIRLFTLTGSGDSYVTIQNLDLDLNNVGLHGVRLDNSGSSAPHDVWIIGNKCHGSRATSCIGAQYLANNNIFRNNEVYDNGVTSNLDHGLYISGSNNLIEGNWIYNNAAACIHIYDGSNVGAKYNTVRRNRCYDNGAVAGGSTSGIIIWTGVGNIASENIIYEEPHEAINIGAGCNRCVAYNNTINDVGLTSGEASIHVANHSSISQVLIKNNLIRSSGTAISDGGNKAVLANNITTGTMTSLVIDSTNATLANRNYNILEGASTLIDAGTATICAAGTYPSPHPCSAGITLTKNGSAPDVGAFEAPIFSSCSVEDGDATKVRVLFSNVRGTALQGSAAANWAAVVAGAGATETAVSYVGSTRVDVTLSAAVTNGQTVTIAYTRPSSNMLTDTYLIGNTQNSAVRTFTAQSCTNNVGGAPSVTFEQITFGWYSWLGAEADGDLLFKGVENTNITLHDNACFALRLKMECNGGNCDPKALYTRYSKDGGAYTLIPDTADADAIHYAECPLMPHGTETTERLTSGAGAYTAGTVRGRQSTIDNIDLAQDAQTEFVDCLCVANATPAATYDFRLYDQSGSAIDTYTVTPRVTIGNRRSVWR